MKIAPESRGTGLWGIAMAVAALISLGGLFMFFRQRQAAAA